jgi:hypothetical protein
LAALVVELAVSAGSSLLHAARSVAAASAAALLVNRFIVEASNLSNRHRT